MLKVKEFLKSKSSQLWCADPRMSIHAALNLMTEKKIGALPVLEGDTLVGIISERDMTRIVSQLGSAALEQTVSQHMTQNVVSVSQEETLEQCMQLMIDKNFRHLLVVSDQKLMGVLSIRDLMRVILHQRDALITDLENYIVGKR